MNLEEAAKYKEYMRDDYQNHEVFSVIRDLKAFYNALSSNVFNFLPRGISKVVFNVDTYIYSSMEGTLDSIQLVLEKGRINDAFALTRKYHDAVVTDIFKSLYIQEYHSIENWVVKQVDDWAHGRNKMPRYSKMMNDIRASSKFGELNNYFDFDGQYEKIRKKCNSHSHYNSLAFMMLNDNEIVNENRIKELGQLSICLKELFILHFAYCFHLHPEYMSSSDYIDHMDCGMTPPEGCQYWVAPYIQKAFDKYIKSRMPRLANYIKEFSCMDLE